MSKESMVFVLGSIVFFTPFLGIPDEYMEWVQSGAGFLLVVIGYRLRRDAFFASIKNEMGERRTESFVEHDVTTDIRGV